MILEPQKLILIIWMLQTKFKNLQRKLQELLENVQEIVEIFNNKNI